MNLRSNRLLLLITLFSYLLSFLSTEKWDVPMILALPISCLGIYDFYSFLGPASGISGVVILIYLLVKKKAEIIYHKGLILSGLLLLWGPFIAFQNKESLHIEWQHGFYLFIPQLIFGCCFVLLVKQILLNKK
ncbi:MAG: hypothetical protein Q8L07_09775 [Sediminibacterium sp.]|nr:hypothetical protein [Sediminibacterium sp.]MDP1810923.1 hypothetical protein [Sediminibacterium sp.]MDP3128960.1 hypothetical protein [Sediminibacterium sp.]MDP3667142.1 hypothetical protein [Sediminibacterium sp.]